MRRLLLTFCCTVIVLSIPSNGAAWNKAGHMVTGAIAYKALKQSDRQALARVIRIFRQHPFYEERWRPIIRAIPGNSPDKEGLFLFMHAARWPDDVRGDEDFHCGSCHFVNFRFPHQPNAAPVGGQLLTAFDENVEVVETNSSDEDKAIALSWIFHLVGDVHQPLHTAVLINTTFPDGDRGGTLFFIRPRQNSVPISLHKFWDDLVMRSERVTSVNNRARQLLSLPAHRRTSLDELSETDFRRWAIAESLDIASSKGYRNGALQGGTTESESELLPADYRSTVQPIAERRVVLAGYRLADRLSQWF